MDDWGDFNDFPTCPECGFADQDAAGDLVGLRHDGDETEIDCAHCGAPMEIVLCVTYEYATRKPVSAPTTDGGAE